MTALAFVTTLRHPRNSLDYDAVEQLFVASATSWLRQDDPRFEIVVVGNRRPPLPADPRIRFVEVDFPAPSDIDGPRTGLAAVLRDKGTKNAIGLATARDTGASHVMFVDADDFVSRRLTGFVAEQPDQPGWTIVDGWRINVDRRALRFHHGDFHLQCGSSHIVRADLLPEVAPGATQNELYAAAGDRLERWLGSHMHLHDDLPLVPLPFPGALYRVGTSESHSGNALGGWGRPVPRSVAREFGVPATGIAPWSIARAVLPSPRAIRERLRRMPSTKR